MVRVAPAEPAFDNIGVPSEMAKAPESPGLRRGVSAQSQSECLETCSTFRRGVSAPVTAKEARLLQRGISRGVSGHENWSVSFGCLRDMSAGDARQKQMKRHIYMKSFLRQNGFRGANTVRPGGCFYRRESVYPIHIAAKQGDYELVKILLEAGVDPEKESSLGKTALDFAQEANFLGSHEMVVTLLQGLTTRSS